MFRAISFLGLAGLAAAVVWALRAQLMGVAETKQILRQQSSDLVSNLRQWRMLSPPTRLGTFMRCSYWVTLGSVFVLALTGFLPVIIFGQSISNVPLLLHLVLAPLFAIGVAALALFWARRHSFNQNDFETLQQSISTKNSKIPLTSPTVWQKLCFWASVLLAALVIISTVLMMYPLYGTSGQEWLLHVHGYAGLLLLMVVILHAYFLLAKKRA